MRFENLIVTFTMKSKLFLSISLLMFLFGCSKKTDLSLTGVTDTNATAIVISADGELVDFVHVIKDSNIQKIIFKAPQNGDEIMVVVVGPSIHPELARGFTITSKVAKEYAGEVTVEFKQGLVTSIMGNGMKSDSPLTLAHLKEIKKQLHIENRKHPESTVIVKVDKYLANLVEDANGNKVPSQMTASQKDFLKAVIPAFKNSDMKTLAKYIHRDPEDTSRVETVLPFLKNLSQQEIMHFQFIQLDPDHSDNAHLIYESDGSKVRHSLPPEWLLTLYFYKRSPYSSAELVVGNDNGTLKFPTTYSSDWNSGNSNQK